MQAASKGTYISNKYLSAYNKKRQRHQAKQLLKSDNLEKKNSEDAEMKDEESQKQELAMIKESEKEMKKSLKASSDSEDSDNYDERNRSCEEVHSDELEGELQLSDCEDESRVKKFRAKKKF